MTKLQCWFEFKVGHRITMIYNCQYQKKGANENESDSAIKKSAMTLIGWLHKRMVTEDPRGRRRRILLAYSHSAVAGIKIYLDLFVSKN